MELVPDSISMPPMLCCECTWSVSARGVVLMLRSGLSSIIFQAHLEATEDLDIQPEKPKVVL